MQPCCSSNQADRAICERAAVKRAARTEHSFKTIPSAEQFIPSSDLKGRADMVTSNIKEFINHDVEQVWEIVSAVDQYSTWRSDLSKTETIHDKQFIEYTKEGYATTFTVTAADPYKRWEFDMENRNITGHWVGIFTSEGAGTTVSFTETIFPKKWFMRPFIKPYLKRQQTRFISDLKKALES